MAFNFSLEQQTSPYLQYSRETQYHWYAGNLQLPVSTKTGIQNFPLTTGQIPQAAREPCIIVQVSQPAGRKVVTFTITRIGKEPIAPDPNTDDTNEVLHTLDVKVSPIELATDGQTPVYRMTGQYVYLLYRPPFTTDYLKLGARQDVQPGSTPTSLTGQAFTG